MKNDFGYVYLMKFLYFEDCYKVGSSKDPVSRLNWFSLQYGPTEIVVCGECENKTAFERVIQKHLFEYSNLNRVRTKDYTEKTFVGPARSREHFHLDHAAIFQALTLFNICCEGLDGPEFHCIRPHPRHRIEYGYGSEAFKRISDI